MRREFLLHYYHSQIILLNPGGRGTNKDIQLLNNWKYSF